MLREVPRARRRKGMKRYYVTKKDIKNGVCRSKCDCPVALSIKRRHPREQRFVEVWAGTAFLKDRAEFLPLKVIKFIDKFDKGEEVQPMHFELKGWRRA